MNAQEMRSIAEQSGRKEHERKAYEYFDRKIKDAATEGKTRIFFGFDGGYIDSTTNKWISGRDTGITREDGKRHYIALGFDFEYVGMIGGVWQDRDQEYIVW